MGNNCPYCKKDVGKEIKRKIECKHCGQTIYVRQGESVTEREKEIFDWQKYMEFLVPDITVIRSTVEKELNKRFGKEPAARDLIWGMFNYIVPKLRKEGDLSIIYQNMATFLESEGKQEQANKLKQESIKMTILDFKKSEWVRNLKVRNYEDGFVCNECKKLHNKIQTLEEAYKNPPIPILACKNKQCRCTIEFIYKYD